jgi:hypothetical protein
MSIRDELISGALGAGLSDMRLGRALAKHKRGEYALSSKVVGRAVIVFDVDGGASESGGKVVAAKG